MEFDGLGRHQDMQRLRCFFFYYLLFHLLSGCSAIRTAAPVPFIPTPPEIVDRMLELAQVQSGDVVYDLGSGDGRIVIQAAKKYGVRGVGIEIDPDLVERARERAAREGVGHLVEFRAEDALTVDLSPATVVTLYMLPAFNSKLLPNLQRQMKPGARVVSHDFGIDNWAPLRVERIAGDWYHTHTLYLWKTP